MSVCVRCPSCMILSRTKPFFICVTLLSGLIKTYISNAPFYTFSKFDSGSTVSVCSSLGPKQTTSWRCEPRTGRRGQNKDKSGGCRSVVGLFSLLPAVTGVWLLQSFRFTHVEAPIWNYKQQEINDDKENPAFLAESRELLSVLD